MPIRFASSVWLPTILDALIINGFFLLMTTSKAQAYSFGQAEPDYKGKALLYYERMKNIPEIDSEELAKLVEAELAARGISNVVVADRLDVTKQSVGQWFEKQKIPPRRYLGLAAILNISVEQMLAGDFGIKGRVETEPPASEFDFESLSSAEWAELIRTAYPKLSPEDRKTLIHELIDDFLL
ncbi:hypothetical protein [Zhongshania sp.]|uniref:hypothetical protein n=1 Tax=Zhongshania sp. TaxID=1971902 RepID=UPI002A800D7C|nr:hypothetical protein [Zhongshania sp.]